MSTIISTNLGAHNTGTFGPTRTDERQMQLVQSINQDPQFTAAPSCRYICIDGRSSRAEGQTNTLEHADPQVPGGLAVLGGAAAYMCGFRGKHIENVTQQTTLWTKAGYTVTVHGANGNQAGCAANADMRSVLANNAAHPERVIAPTQALLELAGMSATERTLRDLVMTGGQATKNEAFWGASAEDVAAAIVAAGGEYVDLLGEHREQSIRIDLAPVAARKVALTNALSDETEVQQFNVSLGQYAADYAEVASAQAMSANDQSRHLAAAVLYTVGLAKSLSNAHMPVFVATN